MLKKKTTPATASVVAKARKATVPDPVLLQPEGPIVRRASGIKVRAIEIGYYDHVRRREGDVFIIANAQAFSPRWMEMVSAGVPEKVTGAKAALEQIHDDIVGGRLANSKVTGDETLL